MRLEDRYPAGWIEMTVKERIALMATIEFWQKLHPDRKFTKGDGQIFEVRECMRCGKETLSRALGEGPVWDALCKDCHEPYHREREADGKARVAKAKAEARASDRLEEYMR